jgi:hypothetical protein
MNVIAAAPTTIFLDPAIIFLEQAAARLTLVEADEMELDEAIIGLIDPFEELFGPIVCSRCRSAETARRQRQQERARSRPTPQATIEAILYCVRTRGPKALRESANIARLRDCDAAATEEINRRIASLGQDIKS